MSPTSLASRPAAALLGAKSQSRCRTDKQTLQAALRVAGLLGCGSGHPGSCGRRRQVLTLWAGCCCPVLGRERPGMWPEAPAAPQLLGGAGQQPLKTGAGMGPGSTAWPLASPMAAGLTVPSQTQPQRHGNQQHLGFPARSGRNSRGSQRHGHGVCSEVVRVQQSVRPCATRGRSGVGRGVRG